MSPPTVPEDLPASSMGARRRPAVLVGGVVAVVVAVVFVIVGFRFMVVGDEVSNSSPSADTVDAAEDDNPADEEAPSTTQRPTPPTAVVTPVTSAAPETTKAPATVSPPAVTAAPAPPPPAGFPFVNAFEVPQLGYEPVRGTGCGGDGSIGDVVPDGWWFGGVEGITSASLLLDLVCVFSGDEASARIADCAATSGYDSCTLFWGERFWPVNNTLRYRVVPVDPALSRAVDSTMGCSLAEIDRAQGDELTWVHIVAGRAVHLQHLCPGG